MESPDVYQLTRIRWQLFGSLTFTSERVPERVRLSMWFAVGRKIAADFRQYFPSLPWCLRQEEGEITSRRHFHVLIGGLPDKAVSEQTIWAINSYWQRDLVRWCPVKKKLIKYKNPGWNVGGGMARIRLFDHSLNGVDYVTKCLGMSGSDHYESAKFGAKSSGLMLSKGGEKILDRIIREERRHIERQEKKQGNPVTWGGLSNEAAGMSESTFGTSLTESGSVLPESLGC